ncbi:hypothetical protein [Roseinatronobacter alkalisoli]|uniref:Uncharacterized protein n=1 Tax=Roseinatronobacter alkalisoli TaxID=3028235 RepID=A0ABT5TBH0_9RHOB|nr:hypothetical protein [Roseinatronobacter sp. HJB301]MDD7972479.1 hypothetical protein [Roseinatronobacter sp. HJB301]
MDYMLSVSIDHNGTEQNVVDAFIAWYTDSSEHVSRVNHDTWYIAAGKGFRREVDDDGPALRTIGLDSAGLYQLLAAFFRFATGKKGYAAISSLDQDAPARVVLISNDSEVEHDPTGINSSGVMQSYQAAAVLAGVGVFEGLQQQMFGHGAGVTALTEEADD